MLQYASRVDAMGQRKRGLVLALYASPDGHEPMKQSLGLSGLNGLNGSVVAVPPGFESTCTQ